jgi:hypothetical protein
MGLIGFKGWLACWLTCSAEVPLDSVDSGQPEGRLVRRVSLLFAYWLALTNLVSGPVRGFITLRRIFSFAARFLGPDYLQKPGSPLGAVGQLLLNLDTRNHHTGSCRFSTVTAVFLSDTGCMTTAYYLLGWSSTTCL